MRRRAWGRTAATANRQAQDAALLCKKNQKEEKSARASPEPLRCLSQFLFERRDRLLRGRMCCECLRMSMRTFHRLGGLVFIVDVLPVGW